MEFKKSYALLAVFVLAAVVLSIAYATAATSVTSNNDKPKCDKEQFTVDSLGVTHFQDPRCDCNNKEEWSIDSFGVTHHNNPKCEPPPIDCDKENKSVDSLGVTHITPDPRCECDEKDEATIDSFGIVHHHNPKCEPPPVPEFGLLAGLGTIAAAVGAFFFIRKK